MPGTDQVLVPPPADLQRRTPEQALLHLGIVLPAALGPAAQYVPVVCVGEVAYVSGQGPIHADTREMVVGKVGAGVSVPQAREAARLAGLNALAELRAELGSLDRVVRVAKVFGMVNAAPGFTALPEVMDGCSELLIQVFGDAGRHARSAVGVAELPFNLCMELEMVVVVGPPAYGSADVQAGLSVGTGN